MSKDINNTVARKILELFNKNGIEIIYGVIGDAVFPFFDALGQSDKIKFIGTGQEANAALMASYQGKLTDKLGVCIATSGPGTANLVNGLADAYIDKAPVLVITGQVKLDKIGTGAKQYINQQKLLGAVTDSSELAVSKVSVIPILTKTMKMAIEKKTVTHVSIPVDIFSQSCNSKIPSIETKSLSSLGSGYASRLEELIPILQSAKKPVIIVGKGKKILKKYILELADILGAGIIVAQQAKGVIPDKHPGLIGGIGQAYIPEILNEIDCILEIGTASYEKSFFPTGVKVVQIVDDPSRIDYKETDHAVNGNIVDILKMLINRTNKIDNKGWQESLAQEKTKLNQMIEQAKSNMSQPIQPAHLMTVLGDNIPEDAIISCDVGGFIHWLDTYFQARKQTVLVSSHWRSMGTGLPSALSAALNMPEKKVIALIGDGGFLMSLSELATAVKYNIPVLIIVANNHLYELEKQKMIYQKLNPCGVNIKVPDFAVLAESFGAKGRRVVSPEELVNTLKDGLNVNGPYVIDVQLAEAQLPFIR